VRGGIVDADAKEKARPKPGSLAYPMMASAVSFGLPAHERRPGKSRA
jgi:hypothetical protein